MRAGPVSAAALLVPVAAVDRHVSFPHAHCGEDEYAAFLDKLALRPAVLRQRRNQQRRFARLWPDLATWFAEPLAVRVARYGGKPAAALRRHVSYEGRSYLYYLGLTGRTRLDYDWLLALGDLRLEAVARPLGIDLGIDLIAEESRRLGFHPVSARLAAHWTLGRIALHTGIRDPAQLRAEHVDEVLAAVRHFSERPDIAEFYGSAARYRVSPSKAWITHLHQLGLVLFHRGQSQRRPRKHMPAYAVRPPPRPEMEAVVDRWLAVRRLTDRPITVHHLGLALRNFLDWSTATEPGITRFDQVTRDHALGSLPTWRATRTRAPASRSQPSRAGHGRRLQAYSSAKQRQWAGRACQAGRCLAAATSPGHRSLSRVSSRPTSSRG